MRLLPDHREHLTLRELVATTSDLLAGMRIEQQDGRATPRPDARAVRYYISLGLVDRPVGYRGTSALYGERHVLQLLAAKVLQSRGHSLPAIQTQLVGRDDRALAALLPPVHPAPEVRPVAVRPGAPAGAALLLSIPVTAGVTVQIDPALLRDPDAVRVLPRAIADAIGDAARSLSTVSISTEPPESPEEESS